MAFRLASASRGAAVAVLRLHEASASVRVAARQLNRLPARLASTTRFTKEHEYARVEGKVATCGVTDYAQSALGDVRPRAARDSRAPRVCCPCASQLCAAAARAATLLRLAGDAVAAATLLPLARASRTSSARWLGALR